MNFIFGGDELKIPTELQDNLILFVKALLIFLIGWWIINKICKLVLVFFQKVTSQTSFASFLNSVLKFLLRILLIVSVLGYLKFNVTSLIAAIGASFVAIGISLKDSISNIVGGIILVTNNPIHVGDYIEFENVSGKVVKIEMLFTTLKSSEENKMVVIPNSRLVSNNITRKSPHDIKSVEFNSDISVPNNNMDFSKFFEKEFILNDKIVQLPAPRIRIKKEDNKAHIHIKLWCQVQDEEAVKTILENSFKKLCKKYKLSKLPI